MLKPLLLTIFGSMVVTTSASQIATVNDMNEIIEKIQENVYSQSNFLREGNSYLYKGKEYRSENEILKELLAQNPITEVSTSSDPSKIITDFATGKIDQNKVYSTNINDFTKVARNYFGKTILPSCQESNNITGCVVSDKTAEERAFASYVNPGLTRIKYSYDNSLFYDAPSEAEANYKITKFQNPESTLMYYYNGRYYNAINKNDLEKMKQSMEQGHYYDPSSINVGSQHINTDYELLKPFTASTKGFANEYKNKFKADVNKYFGNKGKDENIFEVNSNKLYRIEIKIGDKKDYYLINGAKEVSWNIYGGKLRIFSKNGGVSNSRKRDTLVIEVSGSNLFKEIGTQLEEFIEKYKMYNSWKCKIESTGDGIGDEDYYDYYTKSFTLANQNFEIKALSAKLKGPGYNHTNLKGSTVDANGFTDSNDLLKVNNNLPSFIKEITSEIFEENENGFIKDFQNELVQKKWKGTSISFKNDYFNLVEEKALGYLTEKKLITKDWIYNDNGISNFSVVKSQFEKEKLLEPFLNKKPNEKFRLNPIWDLELTYNEWKNNFYYLEDANFGKVSIDDYWFVQEKGKNKFQFSDLMGSNIAKTINEARQIQFDKQNPVLYKKFYLYNPNGELMAEDYNEAAAFQYLKTILQIKTGYVSKKELPNLEDGFSDFNNLISNGKYLVYKFKFENQELYFNNYQNALNAYKNNIDLISGVSVIYKREFIYSFIVDGSVINYYWTNDEELKEIATEIYYKYRGEFL